MARKKRKAPTVRSGPEVVTLYRRKAGAHQGGNRKVTRKNTRGSANRKAIADQSASKTPYMQNDLKIPVL